MKITFLGTGTSQGVPVIGCSCRVCTSKDTRDKRLRSSVMIEEQGTVLVIDSGPDFRQQMLREHVNKLDAIIFTHEHKDHIAGLDDVRAYNFVTGKAFDVYASERVQEALRREFIYIFSGDDYPGIPKVNLHTIANAEFHVNGINILPIEVMHYKLPVLGFRIGDFSYITDANFISEKEKEKIRGSKVLVLNALRREAHVSHFTLDEAVKVSQELSCEQTYLTHISHQLGPHAEVEEELPPTIFCSFDGLTLEL